VQATPATATSDFALSELSVTNAELQVSTIYRYFNMNCSQDFINKLKLEVATRNAVNAKLNEAGAKLKLAFSDFVGHKIQIADGRLTKKHQAIADEILLDCGLFFDKGSHSYNEGFRFCLKSSDYSLVLDIDKSYEFGGGWSYVQGSMCFGGVRNKCLEVGWDLHILPTDYNAELIIEDMMEIDRLTQEIDGIKSRIFQFQDFRLYR